MSVDPRAFRSVMGRFATGVVVVTMQVDGELHGMTANAFSSVSLDPPLILVCVDKRNNTHHRLRESGKFAINVLQEDQKEVAMHFASPSRQGAGAFDGLPYRLSRLGNPILDDTAAWIDCTLYDSHDAGDHTIFIGRVEETPDVLAEHPPLLFYAGSYRGIRE